MERKLATVLFVDLVDSTALVSGTDPEVVRRRVTRFFDRVQHCVITHGGIVEKFAGDAVMAAFGVPQAHEDDAERAVRAGFAILEAVKELELDARVGVESGEVVFDETDSTFATGEAVNIAARLQQAAPSGVLLMGPGAYRLTQGRIEAEDAGELDLKGLRPLQTWRAVCTVDGRPRRAVAGPFVGRDEELELLHNTFSRAARDRRAHLFTIYGEPGVGKSRLAHEFLESVEGATTLTGRCLPYGESITYWPLAEMVKTAAGISDDDPLEEAVEKLRVCCEDEAVADLLGLASGVLKAVKAERSQQEIAWAAREWAEKMAQAQPLILVFEDIHWAEDPLFELIEHFVAWVRTAPLLIVCLARPELLDVRPGWGGGHLRSTAIELEPLAPGESEELVDALLDGTELAAEERAALLDKTEGNPLFVEETIRMLVEEGGAEGVAERIPDTLQALIAARVDRIPYDQKVVLQRAAVIGRIFWAGAIGHLSPDLEDVEEALEDLVLREFTIPEGRSTISGERAFRFKHVLIREVAYGGVSKSARADYHTAFAQWLKERAGEELLEVRAYHLDHACALLAELDGAAPPELATEAAAALEAAGIRALAREANRSARKLLVRSVELEPTLERRFHAARAAWRLTDFPAVAIEMDAVRAAAAEAGEHRIHGRALIALAEAAVLRDADLPRAKDLTARALEVLEPDDAVARFQALTVQGTIAWSHGRLDEEERLMREAIEVARAVGRKDLESEAADTLASTYMARLELDEAQPFVERALALAEESESIIARGRALRYAGYLHLLRGELEQADAELEEARGYLAEAGVAWGVARALNYAAWTAWWRGDQSRAERLFRDSIRILTPVQDRATLCESQRGLAQLLVERGRVAEAERLALSARETVGPQDITSVATTTMALGVVRAAQGRDEEAEQLLREAHATIEATDHRRNQRETLEALTAFLRARERAEEAAAYEERLAALSAPARSAARIA